MIHVDAVAIAAFAAFVEIALLLMLLLLLLLIRWHFVSNDRCACRRAAAALEAATETATK